MARVLLVEDDYLLRRVMTLNLVRRGHSVIEADSVASADEAYQASLALAAPFDLIVLDINLPDSTGWDVLRHLNAPPDTALPASGTAGGETTDQRARPPVIVMTAVHPSQRRLDEFHPTALLLKPFPIGALVRLVERVLSPSVAHDDNNPDNADNAENVDDSGNSESANDPPDANSAYQSALNDGFLRQ
jgi:CheY-like chemotaxis protein